jgi:tetratricopeptide (TPR) repeat protein
MDYILQGHIQNDQLNFPPPDPNEKKRFRIFKPKERLESLAVHWVVTDVPSGLKIKEQTIAIDREQAEKKFPDLKMHTPGGDGRVLMASARQSWALVAPTNEPVDALLDLPWFAPGSSQIRKGNGYAKQGRWDLAEVEWQEAASLHPHNTAAWTNLSLAAVAKEDFPLARDRLKHANSLLPGDSTFSTLIWIEQRQRDYHQSLNLPPPESGWTLADAPKATHPHEVPPTPPRDLKEMPWWTAIPFIPPPGWTWKQWWTQPIVL